MIAEIWVSINSQRDYFRQDQDEVLSTPIEIARKLPEDILKLAGYCKTKLLTSPFGTIADLIY
jgi:hypothetical protein